MKAIFFLFWSFCALSCNGVAFAQGINSFLKPSDSLNTQRLNLVYTSGAILSTATLVGLQQVWYSDYDQSNFHFKNDNAEWLQMDKAGHVFSSYHLGRFGAELLEWSGADRKKQLVYGATFGFAFLTVVEVFDGYSAEWGASWGDVAANAAGTALFVSQELLWSEQRITPKFSFHTSSFASQRPEVLGKSISEQILKDYNGQTYWLSANLHSFFKTSEIPKWLNIAAGYGVEGLVSGKGEPIDTIILPNNARTRQFYLSLDVDLTKIPTKSPILKTIFSVFNSIKIPAPTFEINQRGASRWHILYF